MEKTSNPAVITDDTNHVGLAVPQQRTKVGMTVAWINYITEYENILLHRAHFTAKI